MSSASAPKRSGSARANGKGTGRRPTKKPAGRRSGPIKQPWLVYGGLGAAAIVLIVLAITSLGVPTTSSRTETETVAAADGVVQETATGSGNVAAGVDDEVNFETAGTLENVYVKQGQTVKKGQLLAKLNPSTADLALESDEATLAMAEDTLTTAEDDETTTAATADDDVASTTEFAAYTPADATTSPTATTATPSPATTTAASTGAPATTTAASTGAPVTTTTSASAAPVTTPGTTATAGGTSSTGTHSAAPSGSGATKVVTETVTAPTPASSTTSGSNAYSGGSKTDSSNASNASGTSGSAAGSSSAGSSSGAGSTDTAANVAADKVQVQTDEDTVAAAKKAVKETKLYAPVAGIIATLSSDSIGTAEGSSSSSADSSTSDAASSTASAGDAQTAGSLGGSSTASSSSSSSDFAEIVNTNTLTMSVAFSEADINEIKVGQPATVTISALSGVELAGTITSISPVGTTSDDVVSYDATVTIDQTNAKVKSGMTSTASVVIDSQSGVTVPTDAVTGDAVELLKNGKATSTPVTVGLRGTSREIITSGVASGDSLQVTETLPSLGASTSTTSSSTASGLASRFGAAAAAFGGGGAGGGGFGGGGFGGGGRGFGGG